MVQTGPMRRWPLALLLVLVAGAAGCSSAAEPAPTGIGEAVSTSIAVPSTEPSPNPTAQVVVVSPQRVFPVSGEASYAYEHHGYPAADIMAPCGAAYLAPYSGVILEVARDDPYDFAVNDGATRGGRSVSLLGDDGVRYYGSHFSAVGDAIQPGVRVSAGDPLATVGESGDASACHVHFGLSPACARTGDWWLRRGAIWPGPYLDSWRAGGNADPSAEIQQWQAANGCPDHPLVEP